VHRLGRRRESGLLKGKRSELERPTRGAADWCLGGGPRLLREDAVFGRRSREIPLFLYSSVMELPTEKDKRFLAFMIGGLVYG
jgi:hypothetical protein